MREERGVIVKSNVLLESRYKFSLDELKLLLLAVSEIKRGDKDFTEYRVYIKDFMRDAGLSARSLYNHSRSVAERLKRKVVKIETDTGHLVTSFFDTAEFYHGKGYIDFTFSPKLKPYLLNLRREFTVYDIRNVIGCRSSFSIRIYQLCKQYEHLGTRTIQLDTLKSMLGIETEYKVWYEFKRRVLEVAQRELKKQSDIYFTYRTKMKGRKVDAVIFTIKKQRQKRFDFDASKHDYIDVYKGSDLSYDSWAEETKKVEKITDKESKRK